MDAPIITVDDVFFPRFSAPDLDVMEDFLAAFGMVRSARTDDALYMRGTGPDHHVHVTHVGEPAFLGVAFTATPDELHRLAAATGTTVAESDEPGGGQVVRLLDPDGRRVDVFAGVGQVAPIPVRSHPELNTGDSRVRVDVLQRVPVGPSQVKRFGHLAIKTTSLPGLAEWYAHTLGLLVSDDVIVNDPDQPVGRFMRCNRGDEGADHHSLLVLGTGEVKLGHCAWEVHDFDDLMAGRDALFAHGARHYWGVGRHILGGQVFDYWKDPLGFTVEHWTDSDLLTASAPAGRLSVFDGINQWGPNPPADLDF